MSEFCEYIEIYEEIKNNRNFSLGKIKEIREELEGRLNGSDYKDRLTIVVTGSYGRLEASKESDLDLFILFDSDKPEDVLDCEKKIISEVIEKYTTKKAGDTGVFGHEAVLDFKSILNNIGGDKDTNIALTRRMLFLLEGTWLYGKSRFYDYQEELLDRYIKKENPDRQLSLFFLNDIIRYYRTITTDFEFKVVEGGKPWGVRNIKLRYSRKLLYFGGLICVAEISALMNECKVKVVKSLLLKNVLERLHSLGQDSSHTHDIFEKYNEFLRVLNDGDDRQKLEGVSREGREESNLYVSLRAAGKDFSMSLEKWLKEKYPDDHPIHHSLIF